MAPFGRVPTAAAAAGLGARALRVLIAIAAHADRQGRAYPSLARISKMTGIDRRGIPIEVAALVRSGLLVREPRGGSGGANRYTIVFDQGVTRQDMTPDTRRRDRVTRQDVKSDTPGRAQTDHQQTNEQTRARRGARACVRDQDSANQFEAFWQAYPSRHAHANPKKPAQEKFEAAVKRGIAPAAIIRGAENYRAAVERSGTQPRYVAQAVTWLNQERWIDHQQPPEPPRPRAGMN